MHLSWVDSRQLEVVTGLSRCLSVYLILVFLLLLVYQLVCLFVCLFAFELECTGSLVQELSGQQTAWGGDWAVAMFVDKKFKAFLTILTFAPTVLRNADTEIINPSKYFLELIASPNTWHQSKLLQKVEYKDKSVS